MSVIKYTTDQIRDILNGPHREVLEQWIEGDDTVQLWDEWNDERIGFSSEFKYRIKPKTTTIKYRNYVYRSGQRHFVGTWQWLYRDAFNPGTEDRNFVTWVDEDWISEEVEL